MPRKQKRKERRGYVVTVADNGDGTWSLGGVMYLQPVKGGKGGDALETHKMVERSKSTIVRLVTKGEYKE